MKKFIISPIRPSHPACGNVLAACGAAGFTQFDMCVDVASAAEDLSESARCVSTARRYGLTPAALRLPMITKDVHASTSTAVRTARLARELGVTWVEFHAETPALCSQAFPTFLELARLPGIQVVASITDVGPALSTFQEIIRNGSASQNDVGVLLDIESLSRTPSENIGELVTGGLSMVRIRSVPGPEDRSTAESKGRMRSTLDAIRACGYSGPYVIELDDATLDRATEFLGGALPFLRDLGI